EATSQLANGWGEFFGAVAIDGQGNTFAAYNNLDNTWQTHIVHTESGNVTTIDYDNMDAVVRTVRAYGTNEARANEAKYDKLGRVLKELTAEGRALITGSTTQSEIDRIWIDYATTYTYDNAGRRVTSTQRVSGTSTLLTTRYYYDADGRLRFVVDPRGQVSETQYDALGNVSAQINYYVALSASVRDSLTGGLLNTTIETTLRKTANATLDAKTTTTYNTRGQVLISTTAEGASSTLHYNAFGEVDAKDEKLDASTLVRHTYEYDRRG